MGASVLPVAASRLGGRLFLGVTLSRTRYQKVRNAERFVAFTRLLKWFFASTTKFRDASAQLLNGNVSHAVCLATTVKEHSDTRKLPLQGARILVVEDQLLIGLDIEHIFQNAGADVVGPCQTLQEALQAAANETLSAAILDFRLDHHTSEEVGRVLDGRQIPFAFYTGQPYHLVAAVSGRAPVINKPAEARTLVATMAQLLADRPGN